MRPRTKSFWIVISGLVLAGLVPALAVRAFVSGTVGDTVADAVLGQFDFVHNAPNTVDQNSLAVSSNLARMAVDKSSTPNHLWATDSNNNRVLGWSSVAALANGAPATLVIGQPDLFSNAANFNGVTAQSLNGPQGVAVDSKGNVYVSDSNNNNRVLMYPDPFTTSASTGQSAGFSATLVFGQGGDFNAAGCNNGGGLPSAAGLCDPEGLALDPGDNLYIADRVNNRVLVYLTPRLMGSRTPAKVFGQPDFVSNAANNGGLGKNALSAPTGVASDSFGNLYVADFNNNRVLEFNTPLTTTTVTGSGDTTADRVWGQGGSFITAVQTLNSGGLANPTGVGLDGVNNLYIADTNFHRVLEFKELTSATSSPNNFTANHVYGQAGNFMASGCNNGGLSQTSLCGPQDVALDGSSELFVMDTNNNRVLMFKTPLTSQSPSVVLGQFDFVHNAPNTVDSEALNNSHGIALDTSVTPNHLYVVDINNHRVLGFANATSFANGKTADIEIGQPDFFSSGCNNGGVTGKRLCTPSAVAVDSMGNLYVSDFGNNRVLEYNAPFKQPIKSNFTANRVYGQGGNPTSTSCNLGGASASALTLCGPDGMALDNAAPQHLYVADRTNSRVLEYDSPLMSAAATHEYGQGAGTGADFADNTCNQGGGVSAVTLCHPYGVAVDSKGNVYIADHDNNRVLQYNPLTSASARFTAVKEIGQISPLGTDFTDNACNINNGSPSAKSLCGPHKLVVDGASNLWVSDSGNHRVLEYNTPLTVTASVPGSGDTIADKVFGQANSFTSNACNLGRAPSASTLCTPVGVAVDTSNNLLVSDYSNSRVLQYLQPLLKPGNATAAPATLPSFGNVAISNLSASKTVTVTNNGLVPILITRTSFTGTNPSSFVVTNNMCLGYLPSAKSCTLGVIFRPLGVPGAQSAKLNVNDNAANNPQTVGVSGTAIADTVVSPSSLTFTGVPHGTTSAAKNVTITNQENIAISIATAISGTGFAISATTCGASLAKAPASCTVSVTFKPPTATTFNGQLTITDSPDNLSPHKIMLSGTGT